MTTIAKPTRPGTTVTVVGQQRPRALPSLADTVALAITHSGGPVNTPRTVADITEFESIFGDQAGPGRDAVLMALDGGGLADARGAGNVIVNRMAGSGVASATRVLSNGTATGLTLTGKTPGSRYNNVTVTVAVDPNISGNHLLTVKYLGIVVGQYSYVSTTLAAARDQINLLDQYVTATLGTDGVALTPVTDVALSDGGDGLTLTGADYTAALTALQWERFSVLAFQDLTDATIQASVVAWVNLMAAAGRPSMVVVGGALNESVSAASARSAGFANFLVVNIGVGSVHDDLINRDLSTAQLAPRIAGVITARADRQSLTFAKLGGIHILQGPAPDQYATLINAGVTSLSRAVAADASTKVEKGVTTFTSVTDAVHQREVFSDPRLMGILNVFTRVVKEWGDDNIIGDTPVNDDARQAVRGFALDQISLLERRGLIVPNTGSVDVTDTTNVAGMSDAIPFNFGWVFTATANFVFAQGLIKA